MKHQKNGFLTFCFSCLPGAGQMYLGFSKLGISIMSLFFGFIALFSFFRLDSLVFFVPVIWFGAFFDAINRNSMSEDAFNQLNDHYLYFNDSLPEFHISHRKTRLIASCVLILLGCKILFDNLFDFLRFMGISILGDVYQTLSYYLPSTFIALLIVAAGIYLIRGKHKTIEEDILYNSTSNNESSEETSNSNPGGDF